MNEGDMSFSSKILNMHGIKASVGQKSAPFQNEYEVIKNDDIHLKTNGNASGNNIEKTEKKMKFEDFNGKVGNGFETTDDWYASASDVEDSDNNLIKPYGHNAVNPVLECVNQVMEILLIPIDNTEICYSDFDKFKYFSKIIHYYKFQLNYVLLISDTITTINGWSTRYNQYYLRRTTSKKSNPTSNKTCSFFNTK